MGFYHVLDQVVDLLRQRGRVTYRGLKREFHLDDELLEDIKEELLYAHPEVVDGIARVGQGSLDTPVAPARILSDPAYDELLDLRRHTWTAEALALWFATGGLDDQTAIPPLERIRGGDGGEVFEVNRVSQHRQTSTLRISQLHPFPLELRLQDAVFFVQIADDLILASVDSGGQPGDQELEDHSRTSELKIPTSGMNAVYAQPEIFQLGRVDRLFPPYEMGGFCPHERGRATDGRHAKSVLKYLSATRCRICSSACTSHSTARPGGG